MWLSFLWHLHYVFLCDVIEQRTAFSRRFRSDSKKKKPIFIKESTIYTNLLEWFNRRMRIYTGEPSWFILIEDGGFIFFPVGIFFPDWYLLLIKHQIPRIKWKNLERDVKPEVMDQSLK
jgi:hypothetical protein